MLRKLLRALAISTASCAATFAVPAPAALAFTIEPHPGTDVTKGIAGMPGRIELDVEPGVVTTTTVSFQNRTGSTQHFHAIVMDVQGSNDPDNFLQIVREAKYGAHSWITLDKAEFDLQHGDIGHITVTVDVPDDATPGSYYSAIDGAVEVEGSPETGNVKTSIEASVAVQLFFNVPGALDYDGRIRSFDTPRLYQRSRGSYLSAGVIYENTGNVTDIVGGSLVLDNFLGKKAHEIPLKQHVMLRGGAREFQVLWTDPPWIGRFTPKVTLIGKNGKPLSKEFDPIWIVPSWKYWLAVIASLMLPLAWHIRQRNSWKRYLDEEWDEDSEEEWDLEEEADEAFDY